MALPEGAVFAGYTIVRPLGAGGMGEVYLATHPRLPRQDAIKLLPASLSGNDAYRQRFAREADLASKLWHPHIVGVHDRGETDGQLWIAMDYVDGTDAAHLLADRYPAGMPASDVSAIVTAIADALDYAHDQGLLHRDVKPGNIMLTAPNATGQRRILLTDFGIARSTEDLGGLTTTNMAVGTVAYAAPEQLMGAELDGRADQYALAATAYHLLTGAQPFPHSNPAVVISHHLSVDPPTLPASRHDLARLDEVLAIGLAKKPNDRFNRCSDFAQAFSEHVGPRRVAPAALTAPAGTPIARATNQPAPQSPWHSRRSSVLTIGAGLLGIIAIAAGAVIYTGRAGQSSSAAPTGSADRTPVDTTLAPAVPAPRPVQATAPPNNVSPANVLLTPREINTLVAGTSAPLMQVTETTGGMLNNANLVIPPDCVGVIFTGEHSVYATTGFDAMQHQTLEPPQGASNVGLPELIEQTAVRYPTAEQASAVFTTAARQWQSCSNDQVRLQTRGQNGENGRTFTLSQPQIDSGAITIGMFSNSGEAGDLACQQVLDIRGNLLVGVRSCRSPQPADGHHAADLDSVRDDAKQIAGAVLDKLPPQGQSAATPAATPPTPSSESAPNTGTSTHQSGSACSAQDAAKLSSDSRNGKEIVCVNQGLMAPGLPASWEWAQTPPMTTGLHELGAPCDPQTTQALARSTDKYLITCLTGGPNAPQAGYWQRYLGPLE